MEKREGLKKAYQKVITDQDEVCKLGDERG